MSTKYTEEIKVIITGEFKEDIGTRNKEKFMARLNALCVEANLDIEVIK